MIFWSFVIVGVLIKRRGRALRNPGQLRARPRLSLRPYDTECPIKYQLVQFFLPKYSPDLNPIEQVFAKLKHLLRKAAARTDEAVIAAIGQLLGTYTAQECANYFTNAGYGQT
jgi:transposase